MPELPEVENVRRGLQEILRDQPRILRFEFARKDLRDPMPIKKLKQLEGHSIRAVLRRSKYLFFETEAGGALSHLGMTGSWRVPSKDIPAGPHDHVHLYLEGGLELIYRDPRRFGILDWARDLVSPHPRLSGLGPEPLEEGFTSEYLRGVLKSRSGPVKNLLMNAQIVVGIGNIYASEILFRAGVRPGRSANKVTALEAARLVDFSKQVLAEAITAGGSSIRDYVDASGSEGGFQKLFRVYGREGENCHQCGTPIRREVHAGRSSFFCPRCQR